MVLTRPAYVGVGWVIWRDKKHLPKDLIFELHYLGSVEYSFSLNFSRPAAPIIAQYFNLIHLGFEVSVSCLRFSWLTLLEGLSCHRALWPTKCEATFSRIRKKWLLSCIIWCSSYGGGCQYSNKGHEEGCRGRRNYDRGAMGHLHVGVADNLTYSYLISTWTDLPLA